MVDKILYTVSFDDASNDSVHIDEMTTHQQVSTNNINKVHLKDGAYNMIRRRCTCGPSSISFKSLTINQRKTIDYLIHLIDNVNFRSALLIIDGGPGCGKSTLLTYIMKNMRHFFNTVRILTEKLVNLESHVAQLCEAHVIPHAGIQAERYIDESKLHESIMTCTVSKLLYDIMGERKSDSDVLRDRKRYDNEKINSVDAYRSELESIINYYANKYKTKKISRRDGAINLYIIDEYAMISNEKLYFLIGFIMRRDPNSVNLFILSGDVDQVEPIGHENLNKRNCINDYDKPWFELGMCDDLHIVYKSLVHGSTNDDVHLFEKFVLTEPARCSGDPVTIDFIKTYKCSESKIDILDAFTKSLIESLPTTTSELIQIQRSRVDAYVDGTAPMIDIGFKIIVRQNNEIRRLSTLIFNEFRRLYPLLTLSTIDNNIIIGMPYVLLKTLDSKKILCNRSIVVIKSINKMLNGEIDTITVSKISDPISRSYDIGPVYNEENRPWFPLQLACVENSFQIQGMTIDCDIYLDFYNCAMQHRYVMLTRAKSKDQIKNIINII